MDSTFDRAGEAVVYIGIAIGAMGMAGIAQGVGEGVGLLPVEAAQLEYGELEPPILALVVSVVWVRQSDVSRRIATDKVSVRKPEKGTNPKLFYVGVDGDLLNPTMMEPQSSYFWAEKQPGEDLYALADGKSERRTPGGAREVYDVPHMTPWGKKIATYLWTKAIAAGVLLLSALFLNMGFEEDEVVLNFFSPIVALFFLTATMLLLVFDLKKPGRFLFLLTKPKMNSWLGLGGYVLMLYGIFSAVYRAGKPFARKFPQKKNQAHACF
mgnify:CR=1 FL=1